MLPNWCWRQIITIILGECEFVSEYLKKIQVWAKKYDKNCQQNKLGWTNIQYISKHYTQVLCGLQWDLALLYFTKFIVRLFQERRLTFWAKATQLNDIVNIIPTNLQTPFNGKQSFRDETTHCGFCSNFNLTHAKIDEGYFWSLQILWQNGVDHEKLWIELTKEMAKHAWVMKSNYD
jgi:hypothetical protein